MWVGDVSAVGSVKLLVEDLGVDVQRVATPLPDPKSTQHRRKQTDQHLQRAAQLRSHALAGTVTAALAETSGGGDVGVIVHRIMAPRSRERSGRNAAGGA